MNQRKSLRVKKATVSFAIIAMVLAALPLVLGAQRAQDEMPAEMTAKFATGRVVFCVVDHSIVVGAVGDSDAPSALAPAIVPIGSNYLGVLLGAVNWEAPPGSPVKSARFETELPRTAQFAARRVLNAEPDQPSDFERIGIAVLEELRPLVQEIHSKMNLAPGQPLFQLVLTDYAEGYGPEIWSIEYRVDQDALRGNYWNSRIQRPAYHQLYPPEKGQPRVPVEMRYPKKSELGLLDRVVRKDPAFDSLRKGSPEVVQGLTAFSGNNINRAQLAPVANFLRAALPLVSGADAGKTRLVMAQLDDRRGFQWLVPPAQPVMPPGQTPGIQQQEGAPTLRQYTPPQ